MENFSEKAISKSSKYSVNQLKEMIINIQNESKLGIKNFVMCNNIIGFGQYVPSKNNRVSKNKEIKFYYEPENLFTNRLNNLYHVWFTQDMIIMDEKGNILLQKLDALQFNYQTQSPVMDIFGTNSVELGEGVTSGNYKFKIVVHDKLGEKDVTAIYDFKIV